MAAVLARRRKLQFFALPSPARVVSGAKKKGLHATSVSEHCASAWRCHRQCAGFMAVQAGPSRSV